MVVTLRLLVYLLRVAGIMLFNRRVNGGKSTKKRVLMGQCTRVNSPIKGARYSSSIQRNTTCISLSKVFLSINCDGSLIKGHFVANFLESLENHLPLNEIIRNFDVFSEEENSIIIVKIIGFIMILLNSKSIAKYSCIL